MTSIFDPRRDFLAQEVRQVRAVPIGCNGADRIEFKTLDLICVYSQPRIRSVGIRSPPALPPRAPIKDR